MAIIIWSRACKLISYGIMNILKARLCTDSLFSCNLIGNTWCVDLFFSIFALSIVRASRFNHGNIGNYFLEGSLIVSVSIHVRLIMNHETILEQNCRELAHEMVITISVSVCLIINHGTIFHKL